MGGGIEKGRKRKQKTNRKKKEGKKYVENSGFGNQREGIKQQISYNLLAPFISVSLFLNVVPTVLHTIHRLLIENSQDPPMLPQPRTGIIHPLCADKDVAQIGNHCGKLQARTVCCRLHDLLQLRNNKQSISLQPA